MKELKKDDWISVKLTISEWNFIRRMRKKEWWHRAK